MEDYLDTAAYGSTGPGVPLTTLAAIAEQQSKIAKALRKLRKLGCQSVRASFDEASSLEIEVDARYDRRPVILRGDL